MRPIRTLTVGIGLCLLAVPGAQGAEGEVATVRTVPDEGRPTVATLRAIGNGVVHLVADRPLDIPVRDIIRIDFGRRLLSPSSPGLLQLVNGDRIVAGLANLRDEAVVVLWKSYQDWPPIRVPSEAISGLLLSVPEGALQRSLAFRRTFGLQSKSDVVLLQNGDRVAGELLSFDQSALSLSQAGKKLVIELPRIRGITFNSELTSLPPPQLPRAQVTLTDGSTLTGSNLAKEPDGPLRLMTRFGAHLELPLRAISSIRFLDGRTTYLSDLVPRQAELTTYFGAVSSPAARRDLNIAGGPLWVHGRQYPKGLGTRSGSRLTFDLQGKERWFQGRIGIDDLAEGRGSARFAVEVDGKRAFTSGNVTGATEPISVGPIDVSGRQRLALIVEYGELADVDDWADWCDVCVVR